MMKARDPKRRGGRWLSFIFYFIIKVNYETNYLQIRLKDESQ